MTKEFWQERLDIADLASVVAEAKEEALLPSVSALVSTMENRGYKIFDLIDVITTYVHNTHPERNEVVKVLEDAASRLIDIEQRGSK